MVDNELRNQMEQAYIKGEYDKALELSRQLDIQILSVTETALQQKCCNHDKCVFVPHP